MHWPWGSLHLQRIHHCIESPSPAQPPAFAPVNHRCLSDPKFMAHSALPYDMHGISKWSPIIQKRRLKDTRKCGGGKCPAFGRRVAFKVRLI